MNGLWKPITVTPGWVDLVGILIGKHELCDKIMSN